MSKREQRLAAIRELVRGGNLAKQQDLVEALQAAGFDCTQTTVSRDIADLGLKKSGGAGGGYLLPEDLRLRQMLDGFVTDLAQAANLAVVKTTSGTAQGVAAAIDSAQLPEIIGTIAGDDTIMIATKDAEQAAALIQRLEEMKIEN